MTFKIDMITRLKNSISDPLIPRGKCVTTMLQIKPPILTTFWELHQKNVKRTKWYFVI